MLPRGRTSWICKCTKRLAVIVLLSESLDIRRAQLRGTYSAIIAPNKYYAPQHSNFEDSHVTFRNMMPNFAWEVLEVYSGPPIVAFKWRHWVWMKGDYVGKDEDGSTVTIKSHNEELDIQGVTVARLNEKLPSYAG